MITADLLHRAGVRDPAPWVNPLNTTCVQAGITTSARVVPFLGNILHESGDLSVLAENMDYSVEALITTWPSHFTVSLASVVGRTPSHPANQVRVAEVAYGGRGGNRPAGSGDGWLFRGHGAIQTTFRSAYVALKAALKWQGPVETLPAYLITYDGACRSAGAWWTQAGCNALADAGRWTDLRVRANGGAIGLQDALARCRQVAGLMGCPLPSMAHAPAPDSSDNQADALNAAQLARTA